MIAKTSIFALAIAFTVLLLGGCNDKITQIPVISSVVLHPDTIVAGDTTIIETNVKNANSIDVVYSYTVSSGAIIGYGDAVKWVAPEVAGSYLAHVLVTDNDGNQANDSVRLVVIKNDTTTKITGIAAFASDTLLDLTGCKVRLYTSKENFDSHIPYKTITSTGFGPMVSFQFKNIPTGSYYLDVWKDIDFGNTKNAGDYYGWYGTGDILAPNPKPFPVEVGTIKTISVQMWVIPKK